MLSFVSLDGVMQAPGGPNEDTAGGFKYGGWTVPYFDDEIGKIMDRQLSMPFDLLLGRKTYDIFAPYWPMQKDSSIAHVFNKATKYVVSHGSADLTWKNSELITGDVAAKIKKLKYGEGPMLQVHGSGNLIQTLLQNSLVDELWLKIFPVILGSGKRLFVDGILPAAFKLTSSTVTPSGVIVANYERTGHVKTGTFA